MDTTDLRLHTHFPIADVDERIFGGFLEHMGRCVYEGIYDPASRHADEHGCRRDVLDNLRRLRMTAMRYPGGNFASGYHWMDGIGPREQRPTVRELAWQSIEPNRFGTDEYVALCRRMGWTPMLTVNLGTGTPEEARNWVEYCNAPGGTKYAEMRVVNGSAEPHGVKLWCLGNEMDGPWQLGHVPADHYAIRAQQAAKMMKDLDRTLELVACGSCTVGLPTYMDWDRTVLEHLGSFADYISLHRYVDNRAGDTPDFLAVGASIDRQIEEMDAACRYAQARLRSKQRAYLCFDEWNVWYKNMQMDGGGTFAPHLIEEVYNLEDALVAAQFLNAFLRHADSVKIANLAQIVNVIAPLLTRGDELLVQTIFHTFEMFSKRRTGTALRLAQSGPRYAGKTHGEVPCGEAAAVLEGRADGGGRRLHVFLVNRSTDAAAPVTLSVADAGLARLESAEQLAGTDPKAANTFEHPETIVPRPFDAVTFRTGAAELSLPAMSLTALTIALE